MKGVEVDITGEVFVLDDFAQVDLSVADAEHLDPRLANAVSTDLDVRALRSSFYFVVIINLYRF